MPAKRTGTADRPLRHWRWLLVVVVVVIVALERRNAFPLRADAQQSMGLARPSVSLLTATLPSLLLPGAVRSFSSHLATRRYRPTAAFSSRRSANNMPALSSRPPATTPPHDDDDVGSEDYGCSRPSLDAHARAVVRRNLEGDGPWSRTSVCLSIAGGGGHSVSALAATPGASSLLLEGSVVYHRSSYLRYVNVADAPGLKFSDRTAAAAASVAALRRALSFRSMEDDVRLMARCVGVGSASALVSSSSPTPEAAAAGAGATTTSPTTTNGNGAKGRGHVVATRADGRQLTLDVSMEGTVGTRSRTRLEEDVFFSHFILQAIEKLDEVSDSQSQMLNGTTREVRTAAGDCITEHWRAEDGNAVEAAARRVVDGNEDAVVLLPVYKGERPVSFRCLTVPVLPDDSLVFPGSFNPPHRGHVALANAAVRTQERLRPYLHRAHNSKPVFFELSIANADKPAIEPAAVADRVGRFLHLDGLPQQWGVVLTRRPLFAQKLGCLRECVTAAHDHLPDADVAGGPTINFVIGTDTLVRIIDPKYYDDDRARMVDSLLAMRGARFIVGGRLDQRQRDPPSPSSSPSDPPQFVSGREDLEGLPQDLAAMFTVMLESEFRVDVSSSEIRAQGPDADGTAS